jgi:hypothetical protein
MSIMGAVVAMDSTIAPTDQDSSIQSAIATIIEENKNT